MAVGAGSPQLKLQVSLDLTFLRTQLSGLGRTIGDVPFAVVPRLDTRQLSKDINKLQKEIKININDTQLQALSSRIDTARDKLQTLKSENIVIGVTGEASVTQREARKTRANIRRSILEQGGKILLPVALQPISQTAVDAFKADLRQKLGTISIGVKANLESTAVRGGAKSRAEIDAEVARGLEAISAMGAARMRSGSSATGVTDEARRAQLSTAIEDLTKVQLQQLARQFEIKGFSKLVKADLINKIVADASIEMVKRYLDPQAVMRGGDRGQLRQVLDVFARGVFRMLGMDPASIREAERQRRLPPAINWPAQTVQRRFDIGPSSTGRALPPGVTPRQLPGTAFASQRRLVGDVLSPELKEVLRNAANAFGDALKRELNAAIRAVRVRDLGAPQRTLGGAGVAGFLPPASGLSREQFIAQRIEQAYLRSGARGMSVMAEEGQRMLPPAVGRAPATHGGPTSFPSTELPRGYLGAGRLAKGLGDADRFLRQSRVPLTGAITELGDQFGYAIKQVLLFGTAYKALAFFMDLPRQAFDATKSLQLFENQINILTGSASEANRAFGFIDDLVGRFNIPLQSAREGFAQLYASMSPAGIPIGDVENLFEGMSTAAATLGMSSAEMDRMTLAFSQMASKGKIMTEEVTRQLGDVLPGALGKMAQAAQMEIPAFIDAMQKGQLSGEAMTAVLFNMGVILKKEFGEGASQGAKLLRGAMVEIQNSVQRMYEAFRPVVEDLAAQAIPTLSKVVQNVTKGVQTFAASFSSANKPLRELSGTALTVLNILNSLREIAKGVGVVFASILPTLAGVGKVLLFVAEQVARFINTGFGGWLTNVAVQALLLNAALTKLFQLLALNLLPVLLAATKSLLIFSARLQAVAAAKGVATAATFAFTGALKLLLIPLLKFAAPVAIVAGIMAIADAFGSASKRAGELRATAIDATNAIRGMSTTEAIQAGRAASSDIRAIQAISSREDVPNREGFVAVTEEEKAALERSGVSTRKQTTSGRGVRGIVDVVERNRLTAATLSAEGRRAESDFRVQQNRFEEQQASQALRPVELQSVDGAEAGREPSFGSYDASQLDFIKQRAEISKQLLVQQKEENLLSETQFKIAVAELDLETAKLLANEQLRLSRLSVTRENLTEQDKATKLKDEESKHANALVIAQEQYLITTRAIRKELAGSLVQATEENIDQIKEQTMLQRNILQGREQLTLDEQAALEVGKTLKKLKQDEIDLLPEEIALLEKSTVARLKAVQVSERALELLSLRNRAELALILDPIANRRRELEQQGFKGEDLSKRLTQELETERLERLGGQLRGIASSIGDAFGNAFKGIIMGTSSVGEALAGMFRSIADSFADMVSQIISQWMRTQVLQGFSSIFGALGGGLGGSLGGSALSAAVSAAGNMGSFGFNPSAMTDDFSFPAPAIAPTIAPAIAPAIGPQELQVLPFSQQITPNRYANGGIVTGPTLGLVGEGRYNEAIVPLPDGKRIPVDLGGSSGGDIATSIVVNVSNGQASSETSGTQGNQLARELEGAVKQVILKEIRPGGIIFSQR